MVVSCESVVCELVKDESVRQQMRTVRVRVATLDEVRPPAEACQLVV